MTLNYFIISIIFLNIHFSLLFADTLNVKLNLQDLINEAFQNNLELQAIQYNWESDKAKIPQAGALPDPQLGFNLQNVPVNSFRFDQEPMTSKQILLQQKFPFPGKLGLQKDKKYFALSQSLFFCLIY